VKDKHQTFAKKKNIGHVQKALFQYYCSTAKL